MNVQKITTISYKLLRATILLFWIYVGIDKIWQLGAFKIALTQQPVISYFASVLYWLLPVIEISIGVLLAYPSHRLQQLGWWASTILIAIFTIYIGLGVLDIYDKKPCMCTSFLTHISWTAHFLFNVFILMLSTLGLMLSGPFRYKFDSNVLGIKKRIVLFLISMVSLSVYSYKSTHHSRIELPSPITDSLFYDPANNTAMSPSKGLMASTYDRYLEPYRQLFTNSLQTNTINNQILVCNTERRIAIC